MEQEIARSQEAGFTDHLTKPIRAIPEKSPCPGGGGRFIAGELFRAQRFPGFNSPETR
jgi:hypothetical protein